VAYILIVEDDRHLNDLLTAILESDGHTLLRALDGKAALGLAHTEHPDLVIMEVRLPTVDGGDAMRLLKADPDTCDIPIIAVSASATLRAEADDLPVDAIVSRPFNIDDLLAEVTVQLHRAASSKDGPRH
jgi:DNA-binding response OmpR family regulator